LTHKLYIYLLFNSIINLKIQIPESTLVARLKDRDKDAFAYLYDNYSGAVYGVILRIIRNDDVAAEVLQDVFLKIWDRFEQYDATKGRLFTWIVNIARNQAIDKTRSRELTRVGKTDDLRTVVGRTETSTAVELSIDSIGLAEVLKMLPVEQRFVVEHLYLKGYTQSELAEESGLPLGTVKTRLRLAMEQLRKLLNVR
jgi:RNA polymerase sigma factor (sigma-70 family)